MRCSSFLTSGTSGRGISLDVCTVHGWVSSCRIILTSSVYSTPLDPKTLLASSTLFTRPMSTALGRRLSRQLALPLITYTLKEYCFSLDLVVAWNIPMQLRCPPGLMKWVLGGSNLILGFIFLNVPRSTTVASAPVSVLKVIGLSHISKLTVQSSWLLVSLPISPRKYGCFTSSVISLTDLER